MAASKGKTMHNLLSVSVSMTVGTLITASIAASEIELPDSLPQGPIFGETTTVLVRAYPGATVTDIDGDGAITDNDFRLWVSSELLDRLTISDTDDDGLLTAIDEVESFRVLLDKLSGDINGDGIKDSSDIAGFLDLYIDPDEDLFFVNVLSADINLDGSVTAEDFEVFLQAYDLDEFPDSLLVAVDLLANIDGTLTYLLYTQGHVQSVSSGWEEGHKAGISRAPDWVPPNHDFGISRMWTHNPNTSHYRDTPYHEIGWSEAWPPNHMLDRSNSWFGEHNTDTSGLFDRHDIQLSGSWPSGHLRDISQEWHEAPNAHTVVLSRLWPPDHEIQASNTLVPADHSTIFSQLDGNEGFPPNEDYPDWPAFIPQEPAHQEYWSSTWPDGHHTVTSEAFFPPNHAISASGSWSHLLNVSLHWPSNHMHAVSSGWPDGPDGGPRWPANHGLALSNTWDDPAVAPPPWALPPLFPPGHSVSTTIQQWIPIIPIIFPNALP